ncbi:hypothetical protein D2T31_04730 [Sinirhodobacter populi]|uniref:Uncharacterized protein n=1 Tax=Paenirhodobacter populi TaxID=2306993 RepID=A0A443KEU7_9RHOB|nr:hypothetical protein [Sinirhodobacter populi]RWR31310.1 hypothetical protein D2T31_04730 [Sinirhodobacter populi]
MKIHITINDFDEFDEAVGLAKEAISERGDKRSGDIVSISPHVEILPHGGAEFDGHTFEEDVLGSWRIGKE